MKSVRSLSLSIYIYIYTHSTYMIKSAYLYRIITIATIRVVTEATMLLMVADTAVVVFLLVFLVVVVVVAGFLVHFAGTGNTVLMSPGTLLQQPGPPLSATKQLSLSAASHLAFLSSVLPVWLAHLKVPVTPLPWQCKHILTWPPHKWPCPKRNLHKFLESI